MLRRLFRLLVVLSAIVVLAVIAVWIMSNTEFGRERVRRLALQTLGGATHGLVRIGAVHGNLLSGATFTGVSITDSTGRPFLTTDSLSARYVLRRFLSQKIEVSDLVLYRPRIVVERLPGANQEWNYRRLWPASAPSAPGDTLPGWGSWVKFTNATVVDGDMIVRSPWAPSTGLTARVRDSLVKDALSAGSQLKIIAVPGGYQKVVELSRLDATLPLVRLADPSYKNRLMQVSALRMLAFPFRAPAAEVRALAGNFEFNDDSLWWKGANVALPRSKLHGDGVYNISNGDMRLSLGAAPAAFNDFKWLYERFPAEGGGNLGLTVRWKGTTQDYVVRDADLRTGSAHLQGDIGVTVSDTVFYHDAALRFTGLTTRQITEVDPTLKSPRAGTLAGRAKFSGTLRRLLLDADVTFAASAGRGTSRVVADGVLGLSAATPTVVSARELQVRLAPLQIDIVKILFPTLPIGGTLAGTTTLNGSGATQLVATNLDIVHQDGPNRTHAVGRGAVHTTGRAAIDLDVVTRPLALAEISKFAPALPLQGLASGPVHAHGPINAMGVDTRLSLPGGGTFALRGTVDFLSKELGYDVVADATALDLSRVAAGAPRTALTGGGTARGRGFKPATMFADLAFDFGPSSVDTIGVDSLVLRARLANGMARVARAEVRGAGAQVAVAGDLGLDARHSGALTYSVAVDSLGTFGRFLPGLGPDTGAVRPRPRLTAERLRRARADSARLDRETEVARAISGAPPRRVQVDTPLAIPRSVLAGSLRAAGTVTGSIARFSLQGTASGTGLVVRGNTVRHFSATYGWQDARTASSKLSVALGADTVSAFGFAFDSLVTDVSYLKPGGTVSLRVRQGDERDYGLRGDFTLDKAHNELRLADVTLRFDSTTWQTTHPSAVRWGGRGIEVMNLELRSGPTRRIYANGLLPTQGRANFDLSITNFEIEEVADLLQSDVPLTGSLSLDAHVQGVATDPRLRGALGLVGAKYNGATVPDVHGTFAYANRRLTTDATAIDSLGRTLASVNGTIPVDLALSGVTGSRLLDLPVSVTLASDSLPVGLIPQFTDVVTDVSGRAMGRVTVEGTLKKPVLNGVLTLSGAQFKLAATGAFLKQVNGAVRMTGDTVYIDSIAATATGPVRLAGTVAVGNWREPAFNLFLTATDAELLNNERGQIHANAGLRITGPVAKAYVSGQVTVIHGVMYVPQSGGKRLVGAGDPALFSVIDTSLATQRDIFPAQSSLFQNLRVDVDLAVQRNTWVRSRDANVELFTDDPMRVHVVGDALTLTGAVNADQGEYTFLSKRFQIARGSALFIGTPELNPTLQITAEYQVKQTTGNTNIRVLVGGTLEQPRISLESDAQPPLTQSELLSYLAFGESSGSLLQTGTGSLAGGATGGNLINLASARLAGIALGEALNQAEGDAARSLGVDVFNITPGDVPVSPGQSGVEQFLKGTEIEVGRYVNPRTFARVVASPGLALCGTGRNRDPEAAGSGACAPPGLTITHRTAKGYRFETGYTPRYILETPTLAGQRALGTGQFGAFVIREWRF
jgi:translocation and assembly module TamB